MLANAAEPANAQMSPPYHPVGRCIYCGVTEAMAGPKGLSNEHLIPLSLGGKVVLPSASCCYCSDQTSAFEGHVAGKMLENARVHFHWASRNRKPPTTLVGGTPAGQWGKVPVAEHPPAIIFPVFNPPGILVNSVGSPGEMTVHSVQTYAGPGFKEKMEKTRRIFQVFEISSFARTLAKIAHAFAVAELGLEGFRQVLTDLILERSDMFSSFVGNAPFVRRHPETENLHTLSLAWEGDLLLVKVGLYSKFGLSPYWVVSGCRS